MFDFENEEQGHRIKQHSQCCHSMANINLCKSLMTHFYVRSLSSFYKYLHLKYNDLESVGQGHVNVCMYACMRINR